MQNEDLLDEFDKLYSIDILILNMVLSLLSIIKLQLMRLTDASLYFLILHFSSIDS